MLNEETLEERMHRDLGRVQPGVVPLDALIGRGRAIKNRRRAGVLAGLAAAALLGVGGPVVLGGGGSSAKPAAGPTAVLASGTADGKAWRYTAGDPEAASTIRCEGYVYAYWGTESSGNCLGSMPLTTDPVSLQGSGPAGAMYIARLRPDVDRITVTVSDGTVLTPDTAVIFGRRYAFFVLPVEKGVARLDAVSGGGNLLAYTLPYHQTGSPVQIEGWYAAGSQPTQAAVKQTLFSGTSSENTPVTVDVDMGPFGVCYLLSPTSHSAGGDIGPGPDCHALTPPAVTALGLTEYQYGDRELVYAEVNNEVDHVELTLSDRSTRRLLPIKVGGHSFVVTFLDPRVTLAGAKSFGAAGERAATWSPGNSGSS